MSGYFTPGLPAAPLPLTGNEKIPVDTGLSQGLTPESAFLSPNALSAVGKGSVIALGAISSGAFVIDASLGSYFSVTINSTGHTLTLENASPGQEVYVEVTQGAGGSKTITTYNDENGNIVEWPAATAPTLTATAAHIDLLKFLWNATANRFRGSSTLNYVNT